MPYRYIYSSFYLFTCFDCLLWNHSTNQKCFNLNKVIQNNKKESKIKYTAKRINYKISDIMIVNFFSSLYLYFMINIFPYDITIVLNIIIFIYTKNAYMIEKRLYNL